MGVEYLLRELGQLYETAEHLGEDRPKLLSRLPKAAAELLIDGHPLEVMDGDAAHVPTKWVIAVIKEVTHMLNDPRVYILSVLGLQSTGKSTMLNTAFGLQFNVSGGRCTRGAFMQLLPISEEMRESTNCDYVLVVDTEGLRAPELDSQQTQKHDNELATFVIGLANVTLININGEVAGDMDDILQTSVHAFLRMSEVKYHPSCQFVHQNTGATVKADMGRHKFTQKLNDMTVAAAEAEGRAARYKTFNDVIGFDDIKDVHHFPGLWKGDPPMAPINTGYSSHAQNLKCHLVEILEGGTTVHRLSLFEKKVGDMWDALLTEKFIFSFKNTIEITAYNSLETYYNACDWKFQKYMLNWERRAENVILCDTNLEDIPKVIEQKKKDADLYVKEKHKEIKDEMDDFFKNSKVSDVLSQWKAKFEFKLSSLSEELMLHAKSHCEKVGTGRQANCKFEEEKLMYGAMMTERVEKIIQKTKKEQDELNKNLEEGKLDQHQLQKILELRIFDIERLRDYQRKGIISRTKVTGIKEICHGSSKKLTQEQLRHVLEQILSIEEVRTILKQGKLTPQQLRHDFDTKWIDLVKRLPPVHESRVNVEEAVEEKLIKFVGQAEGKLIKKLQTEKKKSLKMWCDDIESAFVVKEKIHYEKIKGNVLEEVGSWVVSFGRQVLRITDPCTKEAQIITTDVLKVAKKYLDDAVHRKTDFHKAYTSELLHLLDDTITKKASPFADQFTFFPQYRIDVYLTACGYAVGKFEAMADAFREQNNPRFYLEKQLKEPLFTKFQNQYYQIAREEAIASTLCAHLLDPIKTQVQNAFGTMVVETMKKSVKGHCFNSKAALKARILIDLGDNIMLQSKKQKKKSNPLARYFDTKQKVPEQSFRDYIVYLTNTNQSLEDWILQYIIEYCDERKLSGPTQLQILASEEVSRLIGFIEDKVNKIEVVDANEWLREFCDDKDIISELGVKLDPRALQIQAEGQPLNLKNFTEQVRSGLTELKHKLHSQFSDIKCEGSMNSWKDKPIDLLMKLCGCTEQCPFCGEICDLGDHDDTIKHRAAQHRPQCLGGYRDTSTQVMVLTLCPANVAGDRNFRDKRTNQQYHPYSEYQKIYPEWSIPPDVTAKDSSYWKWFVGRFYEEIAVHFEAKVPAVPDDWKQMRWEDVKRELKELYKM